MITSMWIVEPHWGVPSRGGGLLGWHFFFNVPGRLMQKPGRSQSQLETSTLFGLLFLRDWLCQLVMWLLEVYSISIFLFFTYFMEIKNWLSLISIHEKKIHMSSHILRISDISISGPHTYLTGDMVTIWIENIFKSIDTILCCSIGNHSWHKQGACSFATKTTDIVTSFQISRYNPFLYNLHFLGLRLTPLWMNDNINILTFGELPN